MPAINMPISSSIIFSGLSLKKSLWIMMESKSGVSPQLTVFPFFLSSMMFIRCFRYEATLAKKHSFCLSKAVFGANEAIGLLTVLLPKSSINLFVKSATVNSVVRFSYLYAIFLCAYFGPHRQLIIIELCYFSK